MSRKLRGINTATRRAYIKNYLHLGNVFETYPSRIFGKMITQVTMIHIMSHIDKSQLPGLRSILISIGLTMKRKNVIGWAENTMDKLCDVGITGITHVLYTILHWEQMLKQHNMENIDFFYKKHVIGKNF